MGVFYCINCARKEWPDVLGFDSIRNYMSKPWFLKMALEAEPTPLAGRIAAILKPGKTDSATGSVEIGSVGDVADGIAAVTAADAVKRPNAADEPSL